jgi:hypothetical protein
MKFASGSVSLASASSPLDLVTENPRKLDLRILPGDNPRVPHISLVFREMWDTTDLDRKSSLSNRPEGKGRVPHVRRSVRGPKTMGEAQQSLLLMPQ